MTPNPLLGVFKPPFTFSAPMGAVVDADGIVICNTATRAALRRKAKISETDNGCEAVNAIGHFIADLLNNSVEGELQQQQRESARSEAMLQMSAREGKARAGDTNI